ncbi:uncharacterized protein LAESUDRAFT_688203 [Laetiporus sulphureus 93-53]|uniref:Uncharacterized protein n=1 Tax=Laetiporus sulphureus 93-53 TaxID=1314785 RepID=A0A165B722_9APHY|nr:uncharacterized protein LAESUDRAFT_688203 [Laetiporus sulphureus 93-53]KZT00394.1 hypothetical protein LAESUDRAFT_688203 [Laetiporus sulphureus 93-53]
MVVLDDIENDPPPSYVEAGPAGSLPPFPARGSRVTLITLPSHMLLRIIYELFPQGQPEGQRRILQWLHVSLRRVNHALYVACMHVLRSTYLPEYSKHVRAPYTSDPFPSSVAGSEQSEQAISPVLSMQRETRVLDLFIALKVREDVLTDESELHLEHEDSFKDLFDLMQPRSRLEDLVRIYGAREGVISTQSSGSSMSKGRSDVQPIPFTFLSISFSPRKVGLVLTIKRSRKAIVEVVRAREDTLDVAAKRLVRGLKSWLPAHPGYMNSI